MKMNFVGLMGVFLLLEYVSAKPRGEGCNRKSDCREGYRCSKGSCKRVNNILNEKYCEFQSDCPSMYFCDTKSHYCSPIMTTSEIMKKQPCGRVHKSFCTTNSHCACNSERLVCEDNECVTYKEKQEPVTKCEYFDDCSVVEKCSKHKCVAITTLEEMDNIINGTCEQNMDCKRGQTCVNKICTSNSRRKR